ncbi:MAG: peptidoglycan DD-metalloendopeptidase family protein [Rhodobacteraceae bacterium]|nr:peptidoglycan DD-metalloendopeptidase family protein [Paracoccaceae bacterium]
MIRAGLSAFVLLLSAVVAQADPAGRAMAAAQALEAATAQLTEAQSARAQVEALSLTIRSYEDGLGALRTGLRDVRLREAELAQHFDARSAEVTRLLSVLAVLERIDPVAGILHPDGALEAARAAQLVGEVAPSLAREITTLRADLEELRAVRRARQYGLLALEQGLEAVQEARIALAQAIADRGPLPKRLVDAPEKLAMLARDAQTLDELAGELASASSAMLDAPIASFRAAHGTLELPVRATVLRRFNQPDALGIGRPGLVLAAAPEALVTAPWSGTVRYAGPLVGQGQVVILEPAESMLMVMAGLGDLMVEHGEILPRHAPLGTMPADDAAATLPVAEAGSRSQTLYFELREGGNPIDPQPWFAFTGAQEPR